MNSMISLFLVVNSCYLCLSKVLFTVDSIDYRNLQELLATVEDVNQDRMDAYTEAEKSFICQNIIESPSFSNHYHLKFIEKKEKDIFSRRFFSLCRACFADHHEHENGNYHSYVITMKRLMYSDEVEDGLSFPLKSFGCLAREEHIELGKSQAVIEVFVSFGFEDYTFTVSVRRNHENSEKPLDHVIYIGIAEFYVSLSEREHSSSSKEISDTSIGLSFRWPLSDVPASDYDDQYANVEPILLHMPSYRRERVCKIAFGSLYQPNFNVEGVKAGDVKTGKLKLNSEETAPVPVLYCSFEDLTPLYLTPSRSHTAAAYILDLEDCDSLTFKLTGDVIQTIPPLSPIYLRLE